MKTYLEINGKHIDLEANLSRARTIITLGKQSDEAYNVIALEDSTIDLFQCQFTRTADGAWKVHNGQWRTECPKGIRSRLQHACSFCMGCCVNVRPAHPIYDWRMPETGTLLNGNNLTNEGTALKDGDVISAGSVTIKVLIEA